MRSCMIVRVDRQGAVCKMKCCDCQATYICKTGRNLSMRLTEHKRTTRNGDVINHIAEHHLQTKHQIDCNSAKYITYSTDYYQWLTLESCFTNLEQTPLTGSQQLPALYRWLIDRIKQNYSNYERTTGQLTIWLTINDCLTETIDGSKCTNDITSLHSQ